MVDRSPCWNVASEKLPVASSPRVLGQKCKFRWGVALRKDSYFSKNQLKEKKNMFMLLMVKPSRWDRIQGKSILRPNNRNTASH